jgi:hypothetical protein
LQAVDSFLLIPFSPFKDSIDGGIKAAFDLAMSQPLGAVQNNSGTEYGSLRQGPLANHGLQNRSISPP